MLRHLVKYWCIGRTFEEQKERAVSCKWNIIWVQSTQWSARGSCRENRWSSKNLWKIEDNDKEEQDTVKVAAQDMCEIACWG